MSSEVNQGNVETRCAPACCWRANHLFPLADLLRPDSEKPEPPRAEAEESQDNQRDQ
jgi:hypothetical protein